MPPSDLPRIEALWVKRAHRGPMDERDELTLVEDRGVQGSADQGGRRQVTVISREVFDLLRDELGEHLDPSMRRANVLVSGVELAETRGHILRLGDALLEIAGETRPCERMDEAVPGLRKALSPNWRGGIYGRVLRGGPIRVGDAVSLDPPSPNP